MEIGMLWFDNDPDTEVASKVARAAAHYSSKYGVVPNLCFAHPNTLNGITQTNGVELELRSSLYVLPDHFWIGLDKETKNDK
jgi:hypothetical protein